MTETICTIHVYDDGQPTLLVNNHLVYGRQPGEDKRPIYTMDMPKSRLVASLSPTSKNRNDTAVLPLELYVEWLANGDVGLSTLAIVQRLTGVRMTANGQRRHGCEDTPTDPGDIRRILRLFDKVPATRAYLSVMRDVSDEWKTIIDHWTEIETQYRKEEHNPSGCAPKTYRMLKQLKEGHNV